MLPQLLVAVATLAGLAGAAATALVLGLPVTRGGGRSRRSPYIDRCVRVKISVWEGVMADHRRLMR